MRCLARCGGCAAVGGAFAAPENRFRSVVGRRGGSGDGALWIARFPCRPVVSRGSPVVDSRLISGPTARPSNGATTQAQAGAPRFGSGPTATTTPRPATGGAASASARRATAVTPRFAATTTTGNSSSPQAVLRPTTTPRTTRARCAIWSMRAARCWLPTTTTPMAIPPAPLKAARRVPTTATRACSIPSQAACL